MPSAADFRYELGHSIHEGDHDALYETRFDGRPAVIQFIRPNDEAHAARLVAEFAASRRNLLDYGEADVFETHVVFAVTAQDEAVTDDAPAEAPLPLYRQHAKLAIGGVCAAAALCGGLIWYAERKPAPAPVAAPVAAPLVERYAAPAAPPAPQARPEAVAKRSHHKRRRRR